MSRAGRGNRCLLLHGWPEFWLTWEPVMTRLAGPLHPDRARPARLRRQRQAGRALRAGPACRRHAGADGRAGHRQSRRGRPRRRRRGDAAAGAHGAGTARRTVLLRFRLSRHRRAHGRARPAERDLVPVLPPDGDGARWSAQTRESCRHISGISCGIGPTQGTRSTTCWRRSPTIPEGRQSRGRLCPLPRRPRRPDRDDAGRGAVLPRSHADLHPLGRARSAVSLCLDRPA